MTRKEKVARAQQLRAQGLLLREIAVDMGVGTSTVFSWLSDPDGVRARARRASYSRPCVDCGAATHPDRLVSGDLRCIQCSNVLIGKAKKVWTRSLILARIAIWKARYGSPPAVTDWNPWSARHDMNDERRARRFEEADGFWPSAQTVIDEFGTWNAALVATGYESRPAHGGAGIGRRQRRARTEVAA